MKPAVRPPVPTPAPSAAAVKARASELGFARVGVARVEALEPEGATLRAWVAAGRHATMGWVESTVEVRLDPASEKLLRGARSVIALATSYAREGGDVGPAPGVVARYARGRDYHNVVGTRTKKLAAWLRARGAQSRASIDTLPVLERAWAQRAGLGFIGKNACLIVPGLGSHVLLSTVVTTAELEPDAPMAERCGSCRRCLDACPTEAFVRERELDARRCISYLTIEHEGPIDEALRPGIGDRFLGCDLCQDVCPFNRTSPPPPEVTAPFAPDPRWTTHDAAALLEMDEATFDGWSLGSPVRRPGLAGVARNAAIVLGNAGEKRHLPVLERTADAHPSATVRDAAAWAAQRLRDR
jgi:epoxyqueuosine reductase